MRSNVIGLSAIKVVLPDRLVPIAELDEVRALPSPKRTVLERVLKGMETVAIEDSRDAVGLAVAAGRLALEEAKLEPDAIDAIITLQSRVPEYLMSSEATHVQELIGARRAFAFAVADLGCANISSALLVARSLLLATPSMRHVLICSGSRPFGRFRYREGVTLNGDAGMAVIVSRDAQSHHILDVELTTDGKFWDLFKVEYQGRPTETLNEVCSSEPRRFELAVSSRNTFRAMNARLLERAKLARADKYIMQNLSVSAFYLNEEALGVKFIPSCERNCVRYGHLGSVDVLLNYSSGLAAGEIQAGDVVLVQNNSPVACWSTTLIRV